MDLAITNYLTSQSLNLKNVLDLGGGDGAEANNIAKKGASVYVIDRKTPIANRAEKVNSIVADFFDISKVELELSDTLFDVIYASYSLCFNKQDVIETHLPFYLQRVRGGGVFCVYDFTSEEEQVTKRTHILDGWFITLLNQYFDHFEITTQKVYEPAHNHTHNIFQLICSNVCDQTTTGKV